MAFNTDPKPGRWILPLVILGMIAFTYFFVRELPEATTDTTFLTGGGDTTTTTLGGSTTTEPGSGIDTETQAYLDELDAINTELQLQRTEMIAVNAGFDASPREISFEDAGTRFEAVIAATQALNDRLNAMTAPAGLEANHANLQSSLGLAVTSATEALSGLRSTDTGELRQSASETFDTAAGDFDTEVTNTHNAASS